MTTFSLVELERRRLTLADAARVTHISYSRLWRASTGGLQKGLKPEEEVRLNRLLTMVDPEESAV